MGNRQFSTDPPALASIRWHVRQFRRTSSAMRLGPSSSHARTCASRRPVLQSYCRSTGTRRLGRLAPVGRHASTTFNGRWNRRSVAERAGRTSPALFTKNATASWPRTGKRSSWRFRAPAGPPASMRTGPGHATCMGRAYIAMQSAGWLPIQTKDDVGPDEDFGDKLWQSLRAALARDPQPRRSPAVGDPPIGSGRRPAAPPRPGRPPPGGSDAAQGGRSGPPPCLGPLPPYRTRLRLRPQRLQPFRRNRRRSVSACVGKSTHIASALHDSTGATAAYWDGLDHVTAAGSSCTATISPGSRARIRWRRSTWMETRRPRPLDASLLGRTRRRGGQPPGRALERASSALGRRVRTLPGPVAVAPNALHRHRHLL